MVKSLCGASVYILVLFISSLDTLSCVLSDNSRLTPELYSDIS